MKSQDQIKLALRQFTGSASFLRYSPSLFPQAVITEGVEYMADECQAYWLLDAISSHLPSVKDDFAVVILTVDDGKALLTIADDSPANKVYVMQGIDYTDFPLDEIKLYVSFDGEYWTILLPSEY